MQDFLDNGYLFDIIFKHSVEGILVTDQKGQIVHCNPRCEDIFGYTHEELIGQPVEMLVPANLKATHIQHRSMYASNPQFRQMGSGLELMGSTKDGHQVPLEISLSHADSKVGLLVICFIVDISTRKRLQDELEKERAMIRQYMDVTTSIFLVVNKDERIIMANNAAGELLGVSPKELTGKNWFEEYLFTSDKEEVRQVFRKMLVEETPVTFTHENHVIGADGKPRLIEWHNTLLKDEHGRPEATLSSGIDITEKRAIERARTEALLLGQENERQRIARELHDGLGQSISAINLNLNAFEPELEKFTNKIQEIYSKLKNRLNETMNEVKSISYNLTPRILEDFGLSKALEHMIEILREPNEIEFNLSLHGDLLNLDQKYALAIYRIVQELVNNSIKHAGPTEINIHVIRAANGIDLLVEDNGKGFDPAENKPGLGLSNVQSRVDILNGELHIDSNEKSGTSISISIPL